MTALERDATEVEALLTDRYLESVLARARRLDLGPADADLDRGVSDVASDRLRRDLVRVHPSFRFEERLALRLADAAAALRMPAAVGAEGSAIPVRRSGRGVPATRSIRSRSTTRATSAGNCRGRC